AGIHAARRRGAVAGRIRRCIRARVTAARAARSVGTYGRCVGARRRRRRGALVRHAAAGGRDARGTANLEVGLAFEVTGAAFAHGVRVGRRRTIRAARPALRRILVVDAESPALVGSRVASAVASRAAVDALAQTKLLSARTARATRRAVTGGLATLWCGASCAGDSAAVNGVVGNTNTVTFVCVVRTAALTVVARTTLRTVLDIAASGDRNARAVARLAAIGAFAGLRAAVHRIAGFRRGGVCRPFGIGI